MGLLASCGARLTSMLVDGRRGLGRGGVRPRDSVLVVLLAPLSSFRQVYGRLLMIKRLRTNSLRRGRVHLEELLNLCCSHSFVLSRRASLVRSTRERYSILVE